jgi:hypothetical protein
VAQARIECRDLGREGGHDLCRNLIRVWVAKYEAGAFDDDAGAADLIQAYEARIAALERLVGKQALELEFLRGLGKRSAHEKHAYIRHHRPRGLSIAQGCRLMGIARSTYYDVSAAKLHGFVRDGPGAGRAAAGRGRLRFARRNSAPDADGPALQSLARARPKGGSTPSGYTSSACSTRPPTRSSPRAPTGAS